MKRFVPSEIYRGEPCSVCAMGCALQIRSRAALASLRSARMHADGYLSLDGMNALIRANLRVVRKLYFKRGERVCLRDFCHSFSGKAVVCVAGHYIYVQDGDYWSFFRNGDDQVICVWEVE